jgi:signal recognition particle receptor subunit beta
LAFIDLSKNEVQCKVVYYGTGRGGKTTNLLYIHQAMSDNVRGKMVTIDTKGDRTLFFDFLPLSLGTIKNFNVRIQLYTVPGQVIFNATRKLVLKGVDGVVFVADSLKVQKQKNVESLENLRENLADQNMDIDEIPLVLQYNKRDLEGSKIPVLGLEEMDQDMNTRLKEPVPWFPASAVKGDGVFETLKEITKMTVKHVAKRLL